MLTLLDVPRSTRRVWSRLNAACWVPVDHDPAPPVVRRFFAQTAAIPVAMSRFGQERLAGFDALYVPHGSTRPVFSPRPQAEARRRIGLPESAFVAGAVAMNKGYPSRKSLPQIVEAFAAFRARHDDAILYLHTDLHGIYQDGVDLAPAAAALRPRPGRPFASRRVPLPVRPATGDEHMADLYSRSTCCSTRRWARASGCRCSRPRPAASRRSSPTSRR